MKQNKPFLIVGGGIAGITLAHELSIRNIDFFVLDSGINHSSRIAAGIINPVVFRRMALSWRIEELLPTAISFYQALEKEFACSLIHKIPIRRAFAHQQELDLWLKKISEESHSKYLKEINADDLENVTIRHSYGTGIVKESYWIDTKLLIDKYHQKLQMEGKLLHETFDYAQMNIESCLYKNVPYEKIIFAQGYHGLENPFFSYLPLQATKGELLTIKNENLSQDESYNYKCFVLPIGNNEFKVGATYAWNSPNVELSKEAKEELFQHYSNLIKSEGKIINHEAGVRPTVLDRRPLVGEHPSLKNLFIFNGLGAKGYLISPKLAQEFVSFMVDETELDKEIDIKRYQKD
jgi:glycine/D-amino acid oxidase-like deaminating enzyme